MQGNANSELPAPRRIPWNKGKLTGANRMSADNTERVSEHRANKTERVGNTSGLEALISRQRRSTTPENVRDEASMMRWTHWSSESPVGR